MNIVIAPDMSDANNPPDKQPVRPIAQTFGQGLDDNTANARLIAAAPEMYRMLREELIPTSDYGGILSFSREAKLRKLFARIDGTEAES
ncbi:MAG: hypothetical protein IJU48_10000 [Synergistaceae bacterium]|nr:hypothetical protein [Synergistaceae bacterium]